MSKAAKTGSIHVGIGGWTYEPWRGPFYPKGLPHARELEYAGEKLTGLEINGTYYRTQSRDSFVKWADAVPDGFVFSVKASRFATNRKALGEGAASVETFVGQGLTALGPKLGPILWQLMPTKKFDADEIAAFLALLPRERDGMRLRHAIEARHESFRDPAFVQIARDAGVAIVLAHSADYPAFEEQTADFVYARLQSSVAEEETGYSAADIDAWAERATRWATGADDGVARDVFLFFIAGAKERNPAAAMALIERLGR